MVALLLPAVKLTERPADREERLTAARVEARHDATLVRRFVGGEADAFVEIVTRHRDRVFAVAFQRLHNRGDAEEIASDTFIRAHRALAAFRGESSLATWLHRIAVNLALNRYWYYHRRARHLTQSIDVPLHEDNSATFADRIASSASGPARETITQEFIEWVAVCTARLGPAQREILRLRNSANASYVQISAELGITIGTVKSRLARARSCLHAQLCEACPENAAALADWFEPTSHLAA